MVDEYLSGHNVWIPKYNLVDNLCYFYKYLSAQCFRPLILTWIFNHLYSVCFDLN